MRNQGRWTLIIGVATVVTSIALTVAAAQVESIPGEYIVKLKPRLTTMSAETLGSQLKAEVLRTFHDGNLLVVRKPAIILSNYAVKAFNQNPLVEYAEPNYIYRINKTPNDPALEKLWGLKNVGQLDKPGGLPGVSEVDVDAVRAWDISTGSEKVIVAVIDTGVDYTHPDLKENMWVNQQENNGETGVDDDGNGYVDDVYGYNFTEAEKPTADPKDDHGHGSHCSGTIGAKGDDGKGIVGVNWNVRIMAVKFLSAGGSGSLEGAIKAIDYATKNGAHIMSNSWGGGGYSKILQEAIERAQKAGVLFVAAAGNDKSNNDQNPTYPASYEVPNVLAVAAINNKGDLASFSNMGKKTVHVAAPGVNIYSSVFGDKYETWSGTSMATPHVSGVAALLLSNEPALTGVELKQRIMKTVKPWPALRNKISTGGIANAYFALTNIQAPPDPEDPANWESQELSFSTDHPYKAKDLKEFEVSIPEAKQLSLYFQKYDMESGYDVISFYDRSGAKLGEISGYSTEVFTQVFNTNYIKIVFKSDDSVQKYGFDITKAAYR